MGRAVGQRIIQGSPNALVKGRIVPIALKGKGEADDEMQRKIDEKGLVMLNERPSMLPAHA
jgi:hypothetical protein